MKNGNEKNAASGVSGCFDDGLCLTVGTAIRIDPLFHDHPPLKDSFYAPDHERSINDGTTGYCRYKNKLTGYHDHFVRSCDPG